LICLYNFILVCPTTDSTNKTQSSRSSEEHKDNMLSKANFIVIIPAVLVLAFSCQSALASADPFIGEIRVFAGNFAPRGWAKCEGQLLPINQNQALFSLLGTMYGGDGRTTFGLPDLRGRVAMHAGNGPGLTPRPQGAQHRGGSEQVTLTTSEMPSHGHQGSSKHTHNVDIPSHTHALSSSAQASLSHTHSLFGSALPEHEHAVPSGEECQQGNIDAIQTCTTGQDCTLDLLQQTSTSGSSGGSGETNPTEWTTSEAATTVSSVSDATETQSGSGHAHNNMASSLAVNYIIALQGTYPSRS
jgi:microcystin-dependent protein